VIEDLSARIDLGDMTIHLPATGEYPGTIRADLARVVVCSPPGVGLRLTFHGNASEIRVGGLQVHGSSWESPDYETATNHADLDARIDFGLIEINPIGGC
jgi:hypothetical protein